MQVEGTRRQLADLRYYVGLLRGKLWLIVLIVALAVGGALALSYRQTPIYESTAKVLVKPPLNPAQLLNAPGDILALETEQEIAQSEVVASRAATHVEPPMTSSELLQNLEVDVPVDTQILVITFSNPSPKTARMGADAVAGAYLAFKADQTRDAVAEVREPLTMKMQALLSRLRALDAQIENSPGGVSPEQQLERDALSSRLEILGNQLAPLSSILVDQGDIIQPADLPASPSSPNHPLNGAAGFAIGLFLAIVIVFLRERLDNTIRSRRELQIMSRAPVLGMIPWIRGRRRRERIAPIWTPAAESYRTLRTALLYASEAHGHSVFLIASAVPGDGKTITAANLAASLAQAGKRVVAVSADLRAPRLERHFKLKNRKGLTEYLTEHATLEEVLLETGIRGLRIIPSGRETWSGSELLASDAMRRLIQTLRMQADYVVIDTPPVLTVSDALGLSQIADVTLFVARSASTTPEAVDEARTLFEQVGANLIGSVLNAARAGRRSPTYYGSYYPDRRNRPIQDGDIFLDLPETSGSERTSS